MTKGRGAGEKRKENKVRRRKAERTNKREKKGWRRRNRREAKGPKGKGK